MKNEQIQVGTVWGDTYHANWSAVILSIEEHLGKVKCKAITDTSGIKYAEDRKDTWFPTTRSALTEDRFTFLRMILDDLEEVQKINVPSFSKYEAMIF